MTTDALTRGLRGLMARQHARTQVAELIDQHGADFVIFTAQAIAEERRNAAYDKYRTERDAARDRFVKDNHHDHT